MNYSKEEIVKLITKACNMLRKNDWYLLEVWVNERSLTHRLAVYLEEFFQDYHVDCEYNRNIDENWVFLIKYLPPEILEKQITTKNKDWVTVYPDIIIHKRWTNENFIVIEAKKDNDSRWPDWKREDLRKLEWYKNYYSYTHAFFIEFLLEEKSFKIQEI